MCNLQYSYMLIIVILTLFSILDINMAGGVPAIFVFGDSLLDVGNNNYLTTLARRNYKPYGIDFGGQPTGRFTNGKTMVDVLGQKIGVKGFIPPYMAPTTTGKVVLKGVNYASGSAGILNRTGKIAVRNINMNAQVDNFGNTTQIITSLIGKSATQKLLKKDSLFVIGVGSNDFILYYLLPILSKHIQRRLPPKTFVSTLITRLKMQVKTLYEKGSRKFIVADVAPIGCAPYMRGILRKTNSSKHANDIVQMFNKELKELVIESTSQLKGSAFVYVNIYGIFSDILKHYKSYGFRNADAACCRLKRLGVAICNRLSYICPDRTKYVFWDGFHPTEAINVIVANRILDGKSPDVFPINVRQLLKARTY